MKILVAISIVPDTNSKINFLDNFSILNKEKTQFIINPYDELCLNKAISLQENNNSIIITVVCVGTSHIESIMRKILAIGANHAIRINLDPLDSISVAKEIIEIIKQEHFDLVFFGKESIDYHGGVIGSIVASILDIPFINNCIEIEILPNNKIKLIRERPDGNEHLFGYTPLIISGEKGIFESNKIKIPNIRGIMNARKKNIKIIEGSFEERKIKTIKFEENKLEKKIKFIDSNNIIELIQILENNINTNL